VVNTVIVVIVVIAVVGGHVGTQNPISAAAEEVGVTSW
jgi:hypothetical protein